MPLLMNERRGLNREDAISYLGVKGTFFDKELRPLLHPKKMGTSLIFDRTELDNLFDEIMLIEGIVGPTLKGAKQWPKEPQVLLKQKMEDGESTSITKESDFKDALKHVRRLKNG